MSFCRNTYVLFAFCLIPFASISQAELQLKRDSSIHIETLVINYDSDSYTITEEDELMIQKFIIDQDIASLFFDIKAYTDSDGSDTYNKKLSENRSNEVRQFLLDKGVNHNQIVSHAYGESLNESIEVSESEKASNRKTEITVFQSSKFVILSGTLVSEDSTKVEGAQLNIYDEGVRRNVVIGDDNKFSVPIPIDRKVELHFIAKDHFPLVKRLKLSENAKPQDISFPMKKMDMGASLNMTLRFEGNKSIVLDYSERELESLYGTMVLNPHICVELGGHINMPNVPPVKRGSNNFDLSIARANEVKLYLTERNISSDRLLARGYGSDHMLFPKAQTESVMVKNRRVEVTVMSCDSTKLLVDDTIENLARFRVHEIPINRKYNPDRIRIDLSDEREQRVASEIIAQIKFLDSIKMDATRFTYIQLLRQYRERTREDK